MRNKTYIEDIELSYSNVKTNVNMLCSRGQISQTKLMCI